MLRPSMSIKIRKYKKKKKTLQQDMERFLFSFLAYRLSWTHQQLKNKTKQEWTLNSPHTAFAPYRSRTQASILHAGWAPILLPARRALVWGQPEGTFPHLQPPHLPAEAHNDFGGTLFLFLLLLLVHHDFLLPVILLRLQEPQRAAPCGEVGGKSAASTRGWQDDWCLAFYEEECNDK